MKILQLADFIGLKCKMYSFKQGDTEDKMAKKVLLKIWLNIKII